VTIVLVVPRVVYKGTRRKPEEVPLCYATEQSACFDITVDNEETVGPGETKVLPTGLFLTFEGAEETVVVLRGFVLELRIESKSGLAAKGITAEAGIIDVDYTFENSPNNEIRVVLRNTSKSHAAFPIGKAIAQASWHLVFRPESIKAKKVTRKGGFGSTGG
jgi:dUTPase